MRHHSDVCNSRKEMEWTWQGGWLARRPLTSVAAFMAGLALSACGDRPLTSPPATRVTLSYVTGAAAQAVGEDGQFRFSQQGIPGVELSEKEAIAFAIADARAYAPVSVGKYEKDRGARIDMANIGPCPRAYYAKRAYVAPPAQVSEFVRRVLDSHWVVPLCDRAGVPVLASAFSARATELIGETSKRYPNDSIADRFTIGIPVGVSSIPLTPEGAAILAAQTTGKRVSQVPELVMPPRPFASQLAYWRIILESPAQLRGARSGITRPSQEVYVGVVDVKHTIGLFAADPRATAQPSTFVDPGFGRADRADFAFTLTHRSDLPAVYESITVVRP